MAGLIGPNLKRRKYHKPITSDAYDQKQVEAQRKSYLDEVKRHGIPHSEAFYERTAEALLKAAVEEKKCISIESFLKPRLIKISTYYDWLTKSPRLKEAHETAMMIFGEKREEGMLFKDENGERLPHQPIMFMMHYYKDSWKKAHEYHAGLKDDKLQEQKEITVIDHAEDDVKKLK